MPLKNITNIAHLSPVTRATTRREIRRNNAPVKWIAPMGMPLDRTPRKPSFKIYVDPKITPKIKK